MIRTEFVEKHGILEAHYIDNIYLKDVVDYIDATRENKEYPRRLKILSDARETEFLFNEEDLFKIIEANEKSLEKYDEIIDAIVVEEPKIAALTMLYQILGKNPKYHFHIFSTKETAYKWLLEF